MESNIHYSLWGKGNEILVIISGQMGASDIEFSYFTQHVPDGLKLVTFHLRGCGKSKPPQTREFPFHYYQQDADDCASLMNKLNFHTYSVLGFCDGGVSAMKLAAKYPSRVKKLLIINSRSYITKREVDIMHELDSNFNKNILADYIAVYGNEASVQHSYKSYLNALDNFYASGGDLCQSDLSNIQCPTHIINGQEDPVVLPTHGYYLQDRILKSQLHVITNGKHFIHQQFPDKFITFIMSCLKQDTIHWNDC